MTTFLWILLICEVVPKIFPNLNVVAHLVVPVDWGSCLPRLSILCAQTDPVTLPSPLPFVDAGTIFDWWLKYLNI